jgi:general secretion pathway protein G
MNYAQRQAQEGFTLVEILIAFALVMIMGAVVFVSYRGIVAKNAAKATIESMRVIRNALNDYREDTGKYPDSLRDLLKKPTDEENWAGPYVESKKGEIKDGFNNPFYYAATPDGEHPYELYSYGPNGKGSPKSEWIDAWKKL